MDEIKEKDSVLLSNTKKESSGKYILFVTLFLIIICIAGIYFFSNKYISNEKLVEHKIKKMEDIVSDINNTIK